MDFVKDIEDALLVLLNSKLNIPVIVDYSNGPEPTGDYGVIGLTVADKINNNSVTHRITSTGFEERVKQDYLLRFTFRFYGESCYSNAFESQSILASRQVQESLHGDSSISYADITSIRRVPEHRQTGYIQRAVYDIKFLVGYESSRDADWFDSVEYPMRDLNA